MCLLIVIRHSRSRHQGTSAVCEASEHSKDWQAKVTCGVRLLLTHRHGTGGAGCG